MKDSAQGRTSTVRTQFLACRGPHCALGHKDHLPVHSIRTRGKNLGCIRILKTITSSLRDRNYYPNFTAEEIKALIRKSFAQDYTASDWWCWIQRPGVWNQTHVLDLSILMFSLPLCPYPPPRDLVGAHCSWWERTLPNGAGISSIFNMCYLCLPNWITGLLKVLSLVFFPPLPYFYIFHFTLLFPIYFNVEYMPPPHQLFGCLTTHAFRCSFSSVAADDVRPLLVWRLLLSQSADIYKTVYKNPGRFGGFCSNIGNPAQELWCTL